MAETFVNDVQTTINQVGGIGADDTSFVVTSAVGFPISGEVRIRVDDEIMLVTSVVGSTLTVTRAIESTIARAHSNGAYVTAVLTAGAVLGLGGGGGGGSITLGGDLGDWTPPGDDVQRVVGVDTLKAPLSQTAEDGLAVLVTPSVPLESPRALVVDGNTLWIGEHNQLSATYQSVYAMNLVDNALITSVDVSTTGADTGIRDLAQDDNYVYVAGWKNGSVAIISKTTKAVVGWGSIPTFTDLFSRQITSVATDNAGNFYALGKHSVNGWGLFKWSTAGCLGAAYDTVAPDLEIYDVVKRIYDYARKIRYWSGSLWVAGGDSTPMLRKHDPSTLALITDSGDIGKGMNVAFDGTYVYVPDNSADRVIKYDTSCTFVDDVDMIPAGEVSQPDGIVFDDLGSGNFMVTGTQNSYCALVNSSTMVATFIAVPSDRWGEAISYNGDFILAAFGVSGGGPG